MPSTYAELPPDCKDLVTAAIGEITAGIDSFYAARDGSTTLAEEDVIGWFRCARETLVRLVPPGE